VEFLEMEAVHRLFGIGGRLRLGAWSLMMTVNGENDGTVD